MAIVPSRGLGKLGIITDVDPFDLPVNAFSFGKNVRFENGRIERGPIFRDVFHFDNDLREFYGYQTATGASRLLTIVKNGGIIEWTPQAGEVWMAPTYWTGQDSDIHTQVVGVNSVIFVNREDHVPWARGKDDAIPFGILPSGAGHWQADWRTKCLCSVAGVLVALNVTKGAKVLPNNVLWSNFVPFYSYPDWDIASTTSSAGENTLAEMKEPIVYGLPLRNTLMIYANHETWTMEYVGGNQMFNFSRQFDKGIIAQNCAVETNSIQYVFGSNDIWMHDGMSQRSIAQGRVRKFIYDNLRLSQKDMFFVAHNPDLNEVMFCYVSDDPYCKFPPVNSSGCNRAAVYNYASETWTFADLPYVSCASRMAVTNAQNFDSDTVSWQSVGGSWSSQEGELKLSFIMGNYSNMPALVPAAIRTYAPVDATTTAWPIDDNANAGSFLYRAGLDLDELNAELRGYKLCSSVYPQIRLGSDAKPLTFSLGSTDYTSDEPVWGITQTYDRTFYKLDHNIAGRFLFLKMEQSDHAQFSMSGLDYDLTLLGSR